MAKKSLATRGFFIEHNRGHHVHVATPADPATSLKNQTIFQFWKQSLIGSYKSAWNIEKRTLQREEKPVWTLSNAMIWYAILPVAFCVVLTLAFYFIMNNVTTLYLIPIFFIAQSLIAILSLECVNYIEHYGIMRREINGKFERVNPLHSWNANHLI